MATTNGFDVTASPPTADVNLSDGVSTYGFLLKNSIDEVRGDGFTSGVSSGDPTFKDAEPFNRMVWDDWSGGYGQVSQDSGGTLPTKAGDPTKYFAGTMATYLPNALFPEPARNLIFPSTPVSPVNTGVGVAIEDCEVPRGVMPTKCPVNMTTQAQLPIVNSSGGALTINNVRVLAAFDDPTKSNVVLTAKITYLGTDYTYTATIASVVNYTGFYWFTLNCAAPPTIANGDSADFTFVPNTSNGVVAGVWIYSGNLVPWFQICKPASTDSYKMWTGSPRRFEVVDNAGTKNVIAITDTTLINATDTTKTERALGGQMTWSMVYNNQLLVGVQGVGTIVYTAAQCATLAAGTTNAGGIMGPAAAHKGKVYCVDGTAATGGRKIQSFDGNAGAFTDIISNDQFGKASSNQKNNINNIFIQYGRLYVLKPEGLYVVYDDIDTVTTTTAPTINQIMPFDQWEHTDNGKFLVYMAGSWFFNVRNEIWQMNFTDSNVAVSVLIPPFPAVGRFTSNNYVSGLATNGQMLFASFNNIGVMVFNGTGWHPVTDLYEYNTTDGKGSGLKYILNTTGLGPDNLYLGDGRYLVQLSWQSMALPFTSQIFTKDQNRCGWLVTSEFSGSLAEIQKTLKSYVLKAASVNNTRFKIIPVINLASNTTVSYRTIIQKTLYEGLQRDDPTNPTTPVTATVLGSPTWQASDFQNVYHTSEKAVVSNDITNPLQIVSASLILYYWNDYNGSVYNSANFQKTDPVYLNAMILKYLPIQKYLARYVGFEIDLDRMIQGFGGNKPTPAQLNAAMLWLRGRLGATTFTQATILDFTNTLKTATGIFQNHRATAIRPTLLNFDKLPNASSVKFDFQGLVSETLP